MSQGKHIEKISTFSGQYLLGNPVNGDKALSLTVFYMIIPAVFQQGKTLRNFHYTFLKTMLDRIGLVGCTKKVSMSLLFTVTDVLMDFVMSMRSWTLPYVLKIASLKKKVSSSFCLALNMKGGPHVIGKVASNCPLLINEASGNSCKTSLVNPFNFVGFGLMLSNREGIFVRGQEIRLIVHCVKYLTQSGIYFSVLGSDLQVRVSNKGGIQGLRSSNMSCSCSYKNCHCAHESFSPEQYLDLEMESGSLDNSVSGHIEKEKS